MDQKPTVSIIVPVKNERTIIAGTLSHLISLGAQEVIVVDGSSTDGTCELVRGEFPMVKCFETAFANRALQMNLGAFEASGDIFLFVHADMCLPKNAVQLVQGEIRKGFICGGFKKQYQDSNLLLKAYELCLNEFYLSWMRCLVGTNAIFVTNEVFQHVNGFPDLSFLEDVMFCDSIKKCGRVAVLSEKVIVSARRYVNRGILRQILRNGRIILGYKFLDEDPESLREIYASNGESKNGN